LREAYRRLPFLRSVGGSLLKSKELSLPKISIDKRKKNPERLKIKNDWNLSVDSSDNYSRTVQKSNYHLPSIFACSRFASYF
jgi:hypothetical protein